MKWLAALSVLSLTSLALAAELDKQKPNPTEIRVVPVDPSPESNATATRIVFPKSNEVVDGSPVHIQLRIEGYPLGIDSSEFLRTEEVYNGNAGQTINVIIDDRPYIEINNAFFDTAETDEIDFDQTIDYKLPFSLSPGLHVIRVFPARSFREGLKGSGCFSADTFYYKTTKGGPTVDLSKPYLTYNQPIGSLSDKQPILLDFYVSNCQLSRDGYKVLLTIDKKIKRTLTSWVPYYIYGLKPGYHVIELSLLDPQNRPLPGLLGPVKDSFTITR
jgi:hypothetical protein